MYKVKAYVLKVHNGKKWCYAGTAWTLNSAEEVLATYARKYGYRGYYTTEERY